MEEWLSLEVDLNSLTLQEIGTTSSRVWERGEIGWVLEYFNAGGTV
jgi:hypothetical protein